MCQCRNCGKKKWSQRRKNVNKALCLTIINLGIWGIVIDATATWYNERFDLDFTNPKIAAVDAIRSVSESSKTGSPVTEDSQEDAIAVPQTQTLESSVSTHSTPFRASGVIEAKIKEIARKENIDWKILMGICLKETTTCDTTRVGDDGWSYGAFQMNQYWQPNTKECAVDLECSAEWTAKRLKKHEHLGLWDMIRSHNGLVGDRDGDGEVDNAYYPNDVLKIIANL